MLVGELGIEPSEWLGGLHGAILRHDPSLLGPGVRVEPVSPQRVVLVMALAPSRAETLAAIAAPLARDPERELVLVTTVATSGELAAATTHLYALRLRLIADGLPCRRPRSRRLPRASTSRT